MTTYSAGAARCSHVLQTHLSCDRPVRTSVRGPLRAPASNSNKLRSMHSIGAARGLGSTLLFRDRRKTTDIRSARRGVSLIAAAADEEDIPDEIWDAEEKANPQRKIRLGVYAFLGLGALLFATGRISALTDPQVGPLGEIMQPSIFGILLDISAIGIAAYFAYEDLKNRDENVKRIWEEFKAKKAAGPSGGSKKKRSSPQSTTKGFGAAPALAPSSGKSSGKWEKVPPASSTKVDNITSSKLVEEGKKPKMFSGFSDLLDQANNDARIQALQMNNALEDAGVLGKLPTSATTSASGDTVPIESGESSLTPSSPSSEQPTSKSRSKAKKTRKSTK